MDFIKELQSFKTIVEEGTFTRAAAKLNYAQSTVTNHIKKLEDELEVALFLEGKSNVLTLEGELLKQEVPELIAHWERVKEQLINASHTVEYSLRMGILQPYDILIFACTASRFFAALSKNKLRDRRGINTGISQCTK